jgi:hypothetical protein
MVEISQDHAGGMPAAGDTQQSCQCRPRARVYVRMRRGRLRAERKAGERGCGRPLRRTPRSRPPVQHRRMMPLYVTLCRRCASLRRRCVCGVERGASRSRCARRARAGLRAGSAAGGAGRRPEGGGIGPRGAPPGAREPYTPSVSRHCSPDVPRGTPPRANFRAIPRGGVCECSLFFPVRLDQECEWSLTSF